MSSPILRVQSLHKNYNTQSNQITILNDINFEVNQPWQGPGDLYKRTSDDAYKWLKDPARANIYQDKGFNV